MTSLKTVYYFTSFVAGGVLLASELLVTRLIGPFFGASLYVWAATIGTTLIGLALGYFFASRQAEKDNLGTFLLKITFITSIYLLILPSFSHATMTVLMDLNVIPAILLSTLIFNLPLFFLMGLFSPIIIQLLSKSYVDAGNYAGKVYGLSTISGVLFLSIVGIFLLPTIGSRSSMLLCSGLMLLTSGFQFLTFRKSE